MNWNDLKFFLALADTRSIADAAKRIRVSQSTVSRRVATLEEELGVTLFDRLPDGHRLTDEGKRILERAQAVQEVALSIERDVLGAKRELTGILRIAASTPLSDYLLIPYLGEFCQAHPKLLVEIVPDLPTTSMTQGEAEIALRLAQPPYDEAISRQLGEVAYGLYASSDYIKARKRKGARLDLQSCDYIGWGAAQAHLPMAQWLQRTFGRKRPSMVASSVSAQIEAAHAGLGLALLPCFMTISRPRLIRVLAPEHIFSRPLWLIIHRELDTAARVIAFSDFMEDLAGRLKSVLDGKSGRFPTQRLPSSS